jgi:APA family basic amino acid/polyamine antiporter
MEKKQERYGLLTAIAMIVGIVIGSGIFFKSDNILVATRGSIFLGIVVFVIGALSIIFGGLCFGELASRTDKPGGLITYAEDAFGLRAAGAFGWFQIFVYYPTLTVVVGWVVGIYTCILFNLKGSLELQMAIGMTFVVLCFLYNTLSPRFGGLFQNASMIIKLIPLILIAVSGLLFGNPAEGFANISAGTFRSAGWISAIAPIAFSFDGWIVSTSIAHEIRNSKKNLPFALIFAPVFILIVYVLYFVGITSYIGPDKVLELGDAHVNLAATQLFGSFAAKAVLVCVIISVIGTVNGVILGFIRLPYSLALRDMIPFSKPLKVESKRLRMPVNSAAFAFVLTAVWIAAHYLTQKNNLLPNSDVSEISIAVSYLLYLALYYQVFRLYKAKKVHGALRGVLVPILASLGSLFILYGALQSPLFFYYAAFCIFVIVLSFLYSWLKKV